MAAVIKTLAIFVLGWMIFLVIGDAVEEWASAKASAETPLMSAAAASVASVTPVASVQELPEIEKTPEPMPTPVPPREMLQPLHGSYAEVCSRFDPVAHPEQVVDILEYASAQSGTPVEILYAVWRKETGHLDGAGSGSGHCSVMSELARRDRDIGSRHGVAMLKMARNFGWDRRYGAGLENMKCSCTAVKNGAPYGYGGCCGPFQFSGQEIDDEYAIPHNLDPLTFCGGAVIAGWDLKRRFDKAFNSYRNKRGELRQGRGTIFMQKYGYTSREHAGWHAALSLYYGADEDGRYGDTALKVWNEVHGWHLQDKKEPGYLKRMIANLPQTKYSQRYHLKLRASAP